jgi:hypothetical protein
MSADYSFLEYSYYSAETDLMEVERQLTRLGFTCRGYHNSENTTLWTQGLCILLVRDNPEAIIPGISGIGFMASMDMIESLECEYDPHVEMYVTRDKAGLRVLFYPDTGNSSDEMLNENYTIHNLEVNPKELGFTVFSGVVINGLNQRQMDFYQHLGFKFTKSGNRFNTLVSKNNRFIIKVDKQHRESGIRGVIADCDDVFVTTSKMHLAKLNIKKLIQDTDYKSFGPHVHKIRGYNCVAVGNSNSYSIENFCMDALPGIDFTFRSRKQYLDISDDLLEIYYEPTL